MQRQQDTCKEGGIERSAIIEKFAQKFWKLHDLLIEKAHENYDKIDEDAVYEIDLECIFGQFMADEFEHCRKEDLKSLQIQGAEKLAFKIEEVFAYYNDEDKFTKKSILVKIKDILEKIKNG